MADTGKSLSETVDVPNKAAMISTNRLLRHKQFRTFVGTFVALCAASVVIAPFLIMLSNSLMTLREAFRLPPVLLPAEIQWANYLRAWQSAPFTRYFFNSFVVTTSIVVGQLVTSVLAAYAFARLEFPGRNLLFGLFLATLMIPSHVTLIPNYLTLSNFDLINSYPALILPFLASGFSTFLIRQFFKGIPRELEDAAFIDGASRWQILWLIFVPLARPAIATAGLFIFISEWNAYLWPLIVTDTDHMRTVQIGLASFVAVSQEEGLTHWPMVLAASVLVLLPTLLIFMLTERNLIKGITMTGIKG